MTIQFKHTAIIIGALLSTAVFSTLASAEATVETGGYNRQFHTMGMMHMLDANNDHAVSYDEYIAFYQVVFSEMDANNNGSIDGKEWIGLNGEQDISVATGGYSRALRTPAMLKAKDANGDGKISKEEFFNYHKAYFNSIDKTGTKTIDPQTWLRKQTRN